MIDRYPRAAFALAAFAFAACEPDPSPPAADDTETTVEPDESDTPVETDDADPPDDSDGSETDPVLPDPDTDPPDPVDTDPPDPIDTDTDPPDPIDTDPVDTDPVDTDLVAPVDTAPPPPDTGMPATDWGAGFTDLTTPLFAAWPRTVEPGDRAAQIEPDLTHGMFVDLDGDGAQEVVLLGTVAPGHALPDPWVLRFDPATEQLTPDPALTATLAAIDRMLMAIVDLDGDGFVDVIRGRWRDDVLWGNGPASWQVPLGVGPRPFDDGLMGGMLADADRDGLLDLARSAQGCRPGATTWTLWYGREPRWLYEPPAVVAPHAAGTAHTLGVVPLGGTDVALNLGTWCQLANPAPGFFVPGARNTDGWPVWDPTDITPSNSVYKLRPAVAGRSITLVIPMGAAMADLDGDGSLDLTMSTVHEWMLLFSDPGSFPLVDRTLDQPAPLPLRDPDATPAPNGLSAMKPWGVAALDLDRDGDNDLLVVNGDDASDYVDDTPGSHSTLLYRNERTHFDIEPTPLGLPTAFDGRSLHVGDLDRDGRPDMIVGGHGELPRVLLNRIPGGRPPVAVRLVGTTSNRLGIGARVELLSGRADAGMAGGAISPGTIAEPLVFLTTGRAGVADVRVTWPSGLVQEVRGLESGQVHTITEPETLRVDHPLRHIRGDGVGTIRLVATPRNPDGSPRAGTVEFAIVEGTGALLGAPQPVGDAWEQRIQAPVGPGYAIIEARIDGVPLLVRPRIGWDR
jgi:hypothetical protein